MYTCITVIYSVIYSQEIYISARNIHLGKYSVATGPYPLLI